MGLCVDGGFLVLPAAVGGSRSLQPVWVEEWQDRAAFLLGHQDPVFI